MSLTVAYRDKRTFEAIYRGHQWKIDLPEEVGGNDKGPTPPEVFLSSLGSCIGVYIVSYCDNVGLDSNGLIVKIDWKKEESPVRISEIDVKINLPKVDIEKRKEAILKVAKKCLIHNTLLNTPEVNIKLSE